MSSDFYKITVNKAVKETDDCVSLSFDIPEEIKDKFGFISGQYLCLLYTSPSPRDATLSRMPSSA